MVVLSLRMVKKASVYPFCICILPATKNNVKLR
jgi:hypothetical protein